MLSAAIETARNNVKETPMHNTASRKKTLLKDLSKLKAEKGDAYKDCTEYEVFCSHTRYHQIIDEINSQ